MAEAAALSTMHGATAASSTSDDSKELRYYYLDKRVKGESVRLALFVGGIEFEDVRLTYHEVQEMRVSGKLPFSQVPALQIGSGDDAPIYAQSQALLRWAGRKGGLYPEKHQLLIDAVTDVMVELYTEMIKVGYGSAMTRNPISGRPMVQLSQNQRIEVARSCGEILFPVRFQQLERLVVELPPPATTGPSPSIAGAATALTSRYFFGDQLTIADLSFYVLASSILDGAWSGNGVGPEVLDGCDKLLNIARLVGEHPRVVAWNAAHPAEWFG